MRIDLKNSHIDDKPLRDLDLAKSLKPIFGDKFRGIVRSNMTTISNIRKGDIVLYGDTLYKYRKVDTNETIRNESDLINATKKDKVFKFSLADNFHSFDNIVLHDSMTDLYKAMYARGLWYGLSGDTTIKNTTGFPLNLIIKPVLQSQKYTSNFYETKFKNRTDYGYQKLQYSEHHSGDEDSDDRWEYYYDNGGNTKICAVNSIESHVLFEILKEYFRGDDWNIQVVNLIRNNFTDLTRFESLIDILTNKKIGECIPIDVINRASIKTGESDISETIEQRKIAAEYIRRYVIDKEPVMSQDVDRVVSEIKKAINRDGRNQYTVEVNRSILYSNLRMERVNIPNLSIGGVNKAGGGGNRAYYYQYLPHNEVRYGVYQCVNHDDSGYFFDAKLWDYGKSDDYPYDRDRIDEWFLLDNGNINNLFFDKPLYKYLKLEDNSSNYGKIINIYSNFIDRGHNRDYYEKPEVRKMYKLLTEEKTNTVATNYKYGESYSNHYDNYYNCKSRATQTTVFDRWWKPEIWYPPHNTEDPNNNYADENLKSINSYPGMCYGLFFDLPKCGVYRIKFDVVFSTLAKVSYYFKNDNVVYVPYISSWNRMYLEGTHTWRWGGNSTNNYSWEYRPLRTVNGKTLRSSFYLYVKKYKRNDRTYISYKVVNLPVNQQNYNSTTKVRPEYLDHNGTTEKFGNMLSKFQLFTLEERFTNLANNRFKSDNRVIETYFVNKEQVDRIYLSAFHYVAMMTKWQDSWRYPSIWSHIEGPFEIEFKELSDNPDSDSNKNFPSNWYEKFDEL